MLHLKRLLTRRLQAVPSKVIILVLVIAIIGFADASYLTVEHFQNVIPPCSVTGGCEKVLTSSFSTLLGIPVSLLGAIYYLLIAIGSFAFLENKNHEVLRVTLLLTILGLLASLWFVFIQVFVIHSICVYCMGSATTSTLLFICAAVIFEKYKV
jgi:uncharacterized membrane protein